MESTSPTPSNFSVSADRVADGAVSAGMLALGGLMSAAVVQGAVFLPLMAAEVVSGPVSLAGQSVVANGLTAAVAGVGLLALPAAKAALRVAVGVDPGKGVWKNLSESALGQKALALSDKLGGFRSAVTLAATSAAGLLASVSASAVVGSHDFSTAAMLTAGSAVVMTAAGVDGLRESRENARKKSGLAQRRAARAGESVAPGKSSGPRLA